MSLAKTIDWISQTYSLGFMKYSYYKLKILRIMNTVDSLETSFNSGDCNFAVISKGDILCIMNY